MGLLSGRPNAGWLDINSFPVDEYANRPLVIEDGLAVASSEVSAGVEFDEEKLAAHRLR